MALNNEVLSQIDCTIYNYNTNSFQIRNYFKTNIIKLLEEYDKIIRVLIENRIKFNILKDNTIYIN
ncbi:hypothetical protein [Poseidonibacter sp.]|uniref:hypothetical protein n=1 Tax=Poseidonibacter sp. TaxID=2321188 RepID=UPI003C70D6E7